jgi:glycosyltransferase involved in cell wall biosynthesis
MKYYLCITPFFPSPTSFVGPYVLNQVKAIARNSDYEVVVLKPRLFYQKDEDYEIYGVKVYLFDVYELPSNMWPNRFCDWLATRSLVRKLKEIGIDLKDVAVAHGHVAHIAAWSNGLKRYNPQIKTVVQHHGFDVMGVTDGRLAQYKWHERHCIRHGVGICNAADLNVGVSRRTLDYVLAQPGIKLKDTYVLYNGIDLSLFNANGKPTVANEQFTIGCVANFWELKDQLTLIKAVERLVGEGVTSIRVIFIGSGRTLAACEAYIAEHGLGAWFEIRKEVMNDKLPDFYRGLDLFVLPSYWEAFGCVYTEAYACGVPFMAVKGQGIAEIVAEQDQSQWLIDKGDDARLAELIAQYMHHPTKQRLSSSIDANDLVSDYLRYLEKA